MLDVEALPLPEAGAQRPERHRYRGGGAVRRGELHALRGAPGAHRTPVCPGETFKEAVQSLGLDLDRAAPAGQLAGLAHDRPGATVLIAPRVGPRPGARRARAGIGS